VDQEDGLPGLRGAVEIGVERAAAGGERQLLAGGRRRERSDPRLGRGKREGQGEGEGAPEAEGEHHEDRR
jgi:hypothetical protein